MSKKRKRCKKCGAARDGKQCLECGYESKRGGARENSGPKRDPLKDLRTGALTAQKLLKELKEIEEIKRIYKLLTPAQQLTTIFKLRDSGYGRAPVSEEQQQESVVPRTINVIVRRIGA